MDFGQPDEYFNRLLAVNRLRQSPIIDFYPWNHPIACQKRQSKVGKTTHDPLRLARYYQSILDSGKFESRAALSRFLGVSRARVTQVLNRLQSAAAVPHPDLVKNEPDVA